MERAAQLCHTLRPKRDDRRVERSMGTSSNKDVFAALETQVERVLRGENVTLFAFGQVGSGKTYSMSGPEEALVDLQM